MHFVCGEENKRRRMINASTVKVSGKKRFSDTFVSLSFDHRTKDRRFDDSFDPPMELLMKYINLW